MGLRAWLLAAACLVALASPASTQVPLVVNVVTTCGTLSTAYVAGSNRAATQDVNGTFCVNATVSASVSGFPGTTQTTGTPISVTTGGVTGTLPAGAEVVATNVGATNTAYCKLGASATTSDQPIFPNSWFGFAVGSNTQLTCITSTSTTTVNMVGGAGLPTGAGGSSSGSGGAITAASGAFASGSLAAGSHAAGAGVDGWDLSVGTTTATAATAGGTGTVQAKLRLVTSQLDTINTNIQAGASATGGAVPASAIYMGVNVGGNLTGFAPGTAGTASTQVVSVQGIASMTPLLSAQSGTWNITNVSGTVSLPTGASTATNQASTNTKLDTIIANQATELAAIQGAVPCLNATAFNTNSYSNAGVNPVNCDLNGSIYTHPPANQTVNVAQINGVTPLMGAGNTGTGSPRVTQATDQVALAAWGHVATGAAPPAGSTYVSALGSGATGGLARGLITCDNYAKYSGADNGSKTLVTGVSGRKIYICGHLLSTAGTATALKLREGSDADCATNGNDITPAISLAANDRVGEKTPFWAGMVVSTNAYYVCINASAGNQHEGQIWYAVL